MGGQDTDQGPSPERQILKFNHPAELQHGWAPYSELTLCSCIRALVTWFSRPTCSLHSSPPPIPSLSFL